MSQIPDAVRLEMARFVHPETAAIDGEMVARVAFTLNALGFDDIPVAAGAVFAGMMVMSAVADDALELGVLRPHEAGAVRQMAKELASVCVQLGSEVTA
jgi:hypothetical protein